VRGGKSYQKSLPPIGADNMGRRSGSCVA